jgi:hypothetical protein
MNKIILIITFMFLAVSGKAFAGTETVTWDAVADATSYELYQSVDVGVTWTTIASPTALVACNGTAKCSATLALPSTGYVLLRVASKNVVGTSVRFGSGLWHCQSCTPPTTAVNVGVK